MVKVKKRKNNGLIKDNKTLFLIGLIVIMGFVAILVGSFVNKQKIATKSKAEENVGTLGNIYTGFGSYVFNDNQKTTQSLIETNGDAWMRTCNIDFSDCPNDGSKWTKVINLNSIKEIRALAASGVSIDFRGFSQFEYKANDGNVYLYQTIVFNQGAVYRICPIDGSTGALKCLEQDKFNYIDLRPVISQINGNSRDKNKVKELEGYTAYVTTERAGPLVQDILTQAFLTSGDGNYKGENAYVRSCRFKARNGRNPDIFSCGSWQKTNLNSVVGQIKNSNANVKKIYELQEYETDIFEINGQGKARQSFIALTNNWSEDYYYRRSRGYYRTCNVDQNGKILPCPEKWIEVMLPVKFAQ